jgi:hypothetical protein
MIGEHEARRKRAARQREAVAREHRLTEAVALLRDRLGDDLERFVDLLDNTAPYRLRELLHEELDRLPPLVEVIPPIDEAKAERLRKEWASRPHVGFKLDRTR